MAKTPRARPSMPSQAEQILRLFDEIPDVVLFVKDRQSRFIGCNAAWLKLYRCRTVAEIAGKGDADFHPPALAAQYVAEDRQVMRSAKPLRDQSWLVPDLTGMPRWYLCTKIPLFDDRGNVSGLAGILRPFDHAGNAPEEYRRLTPALKYVIAHYPRPIACADLAERAGLSVSQLQREFRRLFNISPGDYILYTRLTMARRQLEQTNEPIGRIASDCGFYDQAHFTRAFRRHAGLPPQQYRQRHASRASTG
ncbi:MAG: AraC family transcriptional regulator [Planctomycetia bacterium]|nr:AraC family transcriptional regulator [Planctomycetia bacterium]